MDNSRDSDWDPPESSDDEDFGFTDEPEGGLARNPRIPLPGVDEIRIFTIDPPYGTELSCHFQRISISDPSPYCALSYAWGEIESDNSHLTHHILLDGEVLKITKSLYQALVRIRRMQYDENHIDPACNVPALWVDAVCINQDDPIERSRQVMMMGQIYASARRLLVWLGEDMPDIRDFAEPRHVTDIACAGDSLLQRRYFTRMWVVQEAICANAVRCTLLFNGFRGSVSNLVAVLENRDTSLKEVDEAEESNNIPELDTLMSNLLKFSNKRCSDDRDRIYALRSISNDGRAVTIDYSQTCESLYSALADQWLRRGHACAMLLTAGLLERSELEQRMFPSLPSWVPDWRLPVYDSKNAREFIDTVVHIISQASLQDNRHSNATNAIPQRSKDGSVLEVQGWLFPPCGHYIASLRNTPFMYISTSECVRCYMVQRDSHYSHVEPGIAVTIADTDIFFIPDCHERYVFRLGEYDPAHNSHTRLHPLLCPWHDVEGALAGDSRFKPTLQTVRLR